MNALLLLLAMALPPGAHAPSNPHSLVGQNLGVAKDWTAEYKFADWFKTSRPWISGSLGYTANGAFVAPVWSDGKPVALDGAGWVASTAPHQIVRTLFGYSVNLRMPDGRYTVTYRGKGTVTYGGAATKVVAESSPGKDVVQVTTAQVGQDTNGGWWLGLSEVDPLDPVRGIQVAPPGYAGLLDTVMFHADFVNALQPFSIVRWLWPQDANSPQVEAALISWANRPHLDDIRWSTLGVPLEAIIRFSNETHTHPWVIVPARASDDYVRGMATLFRDTLDPGLKVYVEYSNEQWNGDVYVSTYQWMRDRGLAAGYGAARPGAPVDPRLAATRYYARRTAEIGDLFTTVYGAAARAQRVVRVLAGQAGNPWVLDQGCRFVVPGQTLPVCRRLDAIAIAPYFNFRFTGDPTVGRAEVERLKGLTLDAIFAELQGSLVPDTIRGVAGNAAIAAAYPGLRLIGYEGGQHLITPAYAPDAQLESLFNAVNRDPRMGALYTQLLDGWKAAGGQEIVLFALAGAYGTGAYGRFGALEWMTQPPTPKYQAQVAWSVAHPGL